MASRADARPARRHRPRAGDGRRWSGVARQVHRAQGRRQSATETVATPVRRACCARRSFARRWRLCTHSDGPADVVRHAAVEPVQLAMVRDGPDADHRRLLVDHSRGRPRCSALDRPRWRRQASRSCVALMAANYGIRAAAPPAGVGDGVATLRSAPCRRRATGGRVRIAARLVAASRRTRGPAGPLPGRNGCHPDLSCRRSSGASSRNCRTGTDRRHRRRRSRRMRIPMITWRRPNRWNALTRAATRDRAGPAGILAVSRRAGRSSSRRARRPSSSPTCASPWTRQPADCRRADRRCSRRPSGSVRATRSSRRRLGAS